MEIFGINFNEFEMVKGSLGDREGTGRGQGGDRLLPPSHWCLGLVLTDQRPTEIGNFFEIVRKKSNKT